MINLTDEQQERLEFIFENAPDRLLRTARALQNGQRLRGSSSLQQPS
jgi:hypothetical protein